MAKGSNVLDVKIDPVMEKPWQRAHRFEQYDYFNKSSYPPMQIEPLVDERSRLTGAGMTPEQRALRKQWVKDQILHHEPRNVPEVKPYNIFRRIYRWPADMLIYKPVNTYFGPAVADPVRYIIPKIIMGFFATCYIWYQIKYCRDNWTRSKGFNIYEAKPVLFGQEAAAAPMEKDKTDFYDRGFKNRQALLFKE